MATDHLTRARDATGDEDRLDALLDAWRARPIDQLVPLIELGARRATQHRPLRVTARKADDEHAEWLATVELGHPVDLDWLLAHVVTAHGLMARARIVRLLDWPLDPRFARALFGLARARPLSTHRPFWTMVFRILHRNAHPRFAGLIEPLLRGPRVTTFDDYLHAKLAALADRARGMASVAATPRELALMSEIATRVAASDEGSARRTADDFVREIRHAPADLGLREVFADWLMQRGDPRGEFIALQLARHRGDLDATGRRLERALLAEHARTWMGSLEPAVHATEFRFERGFLGSCTIVWRRLASLPALMIDPAWATVREFQISAEGMAACAEWIGHMRALGAERRR